MSSENVSEIQELAHLVFPNTFHHEQIITINKILFIIVSYRLMMKCWRKYASERPRFEEICQYLDNIIEDMKRESYCESDSDDGETLSREGSKRFPTRSPSFKSGVSLSQLNFQQHSKIVALSTELNAGSNMYPWIHKGTKGTSCREIHV